MAEPIKRVPSTMVVGTHGQPVVRRGYFEIHGVRIYQDAAVVGPHGQLTHSPGTIELAPPDYGEAE